MSKKKHKPLPTDAAAAANAVKMPPRDTRADGTPFSGTETSASKAPSAAVGAGAGLSAPNWTPDSGEPKTPAQDFVDAVISGDRDRMEAAYAKVGISDAPAIKSAFMAMPKEQRSLVVAHVHAEKDLFNPIAVGAFDQMMKSAPQYAPTDPAQAGALGAVNEMGAGGSLSAAKGAAYVAPTSGPVAWQGSQFGAARGSSGRHHAGVDFRAADGSKAVAVIGGTVLHVGNDPGGYDHYAIVQGDDGNMYRYAPHGDIEVAVGQHVDQGQAVGTISRSHLHFEVATPADAGWKSLKDGGSTQWWGAHAPVTSDPMKFFGLTPGSVVTAGQPIGNTRPVTAADIPPATDPFGVDRMKAAGGGGTPEARQVRDLLIAGRADLGVKPLSPAVAAGAVGNMMQEAYQNLRPDAKGAAGELGIGQWMPDRYANMVAWTKANGLDPNSREGQALFYSHELQASPTMAKLASAQTPADATQIIATGFERAGNPMMDRRIGFANAIAVPGSAAPLAYADAGAVDAVDTLGRAGTLSKGSANRAAVRQLQSFLADQAVGDRIGAPLKADGVFGNRTKEAVKNFQAREGLNPDGVVGPQTLAKINASLAAANFGGTTGTEGSPELVGQLAPPSTRDFAAGAAAAAVTVDPAVTASFGRSTTATLAAAVNHPDTFVSSDKEWDPAAARIAGILRDGAAMDAQAKAAMAKAGKTSFAPPIEGNAVPQTLEEYLGGGPGTGPGKEHQFPPQQGLGADVSRAWESAQRAFDIEHWLQEPTVDSGAGTGTFGTVAPASDPYRPTGGYEPGGSNGSSSGGFDAFASGMAQTYTTVGGGGSVFGGSTGGGSATVYSGVTPNTYQDSGNPAGNDYSNVGGIP